MAILTVILNFGQSSYGVMEDDGTATIGMAMIPPSSEQFQVTINITVVTAIGMKICS